MRIFKTVHVFVLPQSKVKIFQYWTQKSLKILLLVDIADFLWRIWSYLSDFLLHPGHFHVRINFYEQGVFVSAYFVDRLPGYNNSCYKRQFYKLFSVCTLFKFLFKLVDEAHSTNACIVCAMSIHSIVIPFGEMTINYCFQNV